MHRRWYKSYASVVLPLLEEIHQASEVNRYVAPAGFKAFVTFRGLSLYRGKNFLNV